MSDSPSAPLNPILFEGFHIPFDQIRAEHVEPATELVLAEGQRRIDEIAASEAVPTWDSVMGALDEAVGWVAERLQPAAHLVSVAESPELRAAFNAILPTVTTFWSRLQLNQPLWHRIQRYAETPEAAALDPVRRRHLDKTMRAFRRAGADLDEETRGTLETLKVELSGLEQRFSENVLDETASFEKVITDPARLEGIPEGAQARFRAAADQRRKADPDSWEHGEAAWLLTLAFPSVEPVLKYADDRELRQEIFEAYTTRCRGGEFDNRDLILQILQLRERIAGLLGYPGFPDFVLEERMARSGTEARRFEKELAERTRAHWKEDVELLRQTALDLGLDELRPWDTSWVMEKLRRERFDLDDEILRPYFPLEQVMNGLFELVEQVFGLRVTAVENEAVWHDEVRYYEIHDDQGRHRGSFYTDWFPRKEKRQGAWMNDFITGGPTDDGFAPHLGVICGNFTPPSDDRPALLTHREVETIFHEFGHLLHHCSSTVEVRGLAGINVAWDFVELPSQIMENWTWEKQALDLFARHWETGEPLPDEIHQRMLRARRFMGGWGQMRQISFGTVDLELHAEFAPQASAADADELMKFVTERLQPFSASPEFAASNSFTAFTHLFAGGYASGYYSYLWSEVLDADAFTRFQREGVFNPEVGRAYLDAILSRGDSAPPEELFRRFMGRDPDPEALIRRNLGALSA